MCESIINYLNFIKVVVNCFGLIYYNNKQKICLD